MPFLERVGLLIEIGVQLKAHMKINGKTIVSCTKTFHYDNADWLFGPHFKNSQI